MTDDLFRPPFGGEDDDEAGAQEEATRGLPAHERDPDDAVGGGVMGAGGTAVDRGTGELGGTAEGPAASDESSDETGGINEGAVMGPPSGGAQHYVPAFVEDDDEEGGALPSA